MHLLSGQFPNLSGDPIEFPVDSLVLLPYIVHLGHKRLPDPLECHLDRLHVSDHRHHDLCLLLVLGPHTVYLLGYPQIDTLDSQLYLFVHLL